MSNGETKAAPALVRDTKVRIVRKVDVPEDSEWNWDSEMDDYVGDGEVYTVENPNFYGWATLSGDIEGAAGLGWPPEALEVVTE